MSARLLDAGDAAVTVEFGDHISARLLAQVAALDRALGAARARGDLPGVVETVPTFRSLTVVYDPLRTCRALLDPALRSLLQHSADSAAVPGRCWRLPVCYGEGFGADLGDVALATGLSADAVVQLHSSSLFQVAMLGFMPGFAFLSGLPAALQMPRRPQPRLRVPAGAVGITGTLSAVYPWESPGGWQLLGRCPVPLFNATAATPALLAPGDSVRFEQVSPDRFAALQAQVRSATFATDTLLEAA